ncbi:hypothetical protein [Salinibacter ruber]|uniref:hypothetical protein n=1 Tax=Salinibacter ruber TaxID=146919 RepID=UPI002167156F|nr:hypothetical protein [Salinibacter ruber]MCS4136580.1 hypothetical protein [Salinibacter ruber]
MSIHSSVEYERTPGEEKAVFAFLDDYFDSDHDQTELSESEKETAQTIVQYVNSRFGRMKYILGTAIDFIVLAQRVDGEDKGYEPNLETGDVFDRYNRVEQKGGKTLNTLTLRDDNGKEYGIRKTEERVLGLFHEELNRLDYPSAYVYSTGQWHKYQDLLELCFRLSETGRYCTLEELVDYGLGHMKRAEEFEGNPRVRLFPQVVSAYPRGEFEDENGGVVFQALVYGYFKADRPHLSIVVDKVRTGSSRQKRVGDIDCYMDLKVEMSVEVKDFALTEDHYQKELGTFVEDVTEAGIRGAVYARDVEGSLRQKLEDRGIYVQTEDDMLCTIRGWDWPKQDAAFRGAIHYLAHIEQNTNAVGRLQEFIADQDPDHDVLVRFNPERKETSDPQQALELD